MAGDRMSYLRAADPFPLEAPEFTKLHEFYARLGQGRLSTTRCTRCGRVDWPPRGFCPDCAGDAFEWVDLPAEGTVHAFTVQDTGLPAGFAGPRVFAIVTVGAHRVFGLIVGVDPARVTLGQRVRLSPLPVAADPNGNPRWLPAFTPSA
jgi:uncharacterized OB-fold protein